MKSPNRAPKIEKHYCQSCNGHHYGYYEAWKAAGLGMSEEWSFVWTDKNGDIKSGEPC